MEYVLIAAVGGAIIQGIRYAWRKNPPVEPPNTFLSQIQERRLSLKHVEPNKMDRPLNELELRLTKIRRAVSDSYQDE